MHALLPNTTYAVVTLTVAIPIPAHDVDFAESLAADGINAFLNDHIIDHNFAQSEGLIADWSIEDVSVRMSGDDPEEGGLFHHFPTKEQA